MTTYKALISDFDGTLAGDDGEITQSVKEAVEKLIQKGYIFSIATGRPYFGKLRSICKELGLTSPQIAHGGAEIRNPKDDSILWSAYLHDEEVQDMVSYFLKKKLYFTLEKDDCIYTPDGKEAFYNDAFIYKNIHTAKLHNIPKIVISASLNKLSLEDIEELTTYLQAKYKAVHVIKSLFRESYGIDITAGQATKHIAVLETMKMLGLTEAEVVGVGDGYNDYPLLTACGVKVAMGNAPEELRAIADFITLTQPEDGLLAVIKRYFIEQ